MGASVAIPAVLGAVGLYQSNKQASSQNKSLKKASDVQKALGMEQLTALQGLNQLSQDYDPVKQSQIAIKAATDATAGSLEKAFAKMRATRGATGGHTQDSEYHVQAQRGINDQMDPLKMFAAQQLADAPMKKAGMIQGVLGAPVGQIADSYFKSAAMMPRSDPTASMGMLSQALHAMMNKKGAGGSGDTLGGLQIGGGYMGGGSM